MNHVRLRRRSQTRIVGESGVTALRLATILVALAFSCILALYVVVWGSSSAFESLRHLKTTIGTRLGLHTFPPQDQSSIPSQNLIRQLIDNSQQSFAIALASSAVSLPDAAAKYRERRGRHPPPGFETWYNFAQSRNAVIVEQFWDQIYDDLEPLRGLTPPELRRRAQAGELGSRIRLQGRTVHVDNQAMGPNPKLQTWKTMFEELVKDKAWTPSIDIDMPINVNNESAVLVPWEDIETLLFQSRRILAAVQDVISEFNTPIISNSTSSKSSFDPEFLGPHLPPPSDGYLGPRPYRPYWSLVQPACSPSSAARRAPFNPILADIWQPQGHTHSSHSASNLLVNRTDDHSRVYIKDWSEATDVCNMPWLQGLHGAFVAPEDIRTTQKMVPMFSGGGKLALNNDISIPGAGDWNMSALLLRETALVNATWEVRDPKLFWRGPAAGGKVSRRNWRRFQRPRFVSMLNASHIRAAELNSNSQNANLRGVGPGRNFRLPEKGVYEVTAQRGNRLAEWVQSWADVAFTGMECEDSNSIPCAYMAEHFALVESREQNQDNRSYKYTAVIDGSTPDDHGSFLEALTTESVVLRASIYKTWLDTRLWPWVHYVPLDNTFIDLYSVIEFFVGSSMKSSGEDNGHDGAAYKIAHEARRWASQVLRREDMLIYLYRLVLEYARILDDSRERLGWVGDLLEQEQVSAEK